MSIVVRGGVYRMKGRRWTKEEDEILRGAVLKSIRSGETQLDAFADIGKRLGRTLGACGFRWNAMLKHQDPHLYIEAKRMRVHQQIDKRRGNQIGLFSQMWSSLQQVEKGWKKLQQEVSLLKGKLMKLDELLNRLRAENRELTEEKNSYEWYQREVKAKYQELLHFLKHLRQDSLTDSVSTVHTEGKPGIHADTERDSSS
jgi:prespore-specific regulator